MEANGATKTYQRNTENGSITMSNVNAKRDMVTIYGPNGQIVSVIAKDGNAPTPKWSAHKSNGGKVLDAQGNVASVNIPVTHVQDGNGPVTVHDTTDKPVVNGKPLDPRAISERLQGDHKGNPYTVKARTDKGTSGEGKHLDAMCKWRKSTLQCALWQLHGKAFDIDGKVMHVSAMDKLAIVQVLTANDVKIVDIEAMLFTIAFDL